MCYILGNSNENNTIVSLEKDSLPRNLSSTNKFWQDFFSFLANLYYWVSTCILSAVQGPGMENWRRLKLTYFVWGLPVVMLWICWIWFTVLLYRHFCQHKESMGQNKWAGFFLGKTVISFQVNNPHNCSYLCFPLRPTNPQLNSKQQSASHLLISLL